MFDIRLVKTYPIILLFFIPFQYLSPVYFTAFVCYYLGKESVYRKYQVYLFLPFIAFFILYTILKVNIFLEYSWISKNIVTILHTEIDENSALSFSTIIGIWMYLMITKYEKSLGRYSFLKVKQQTKWIKNLVAVLIIFNVLWLLTLVLFYIRTDIHGHMPYYPYWILYLLFYFAFLYYGVQHIQNRGKFLNPEANIKEEAINKFRIAGLSTIFSKEELKQIESNSSEVVGILSYFATSLFDKNDVKDILWDITENCIAQLHLEDVVIYILDEKTKLLKQTTAYGTKNKGQRMILSPIEIPLGKGIVGGVAATGIWECIGDVTKDERYIVDDKKRKSELTVPIFLNEKIFGVLDSENSIKNYFNDQHVFLFQFIAKLISKKLEKIKQKSSSTITDDNMYFKELNFLMSEAKIYRDANLSLETISGKLKISSNYLSQLVNKLSGKSFPDYINGFRIEDAKKKLKDPLFVNYTILSIALESGFNSKSTFYNAFKKTTGISPKEYRKTP